MPLSTTQHAKFAFEVLPLLFHSQNRDFLFYLERDGIKFLQFWWDHTGEKVGETMRKSFEGLNYEITSFESGRKLVFLQLPVPENQSEPFFLALFSPPTKKNLLPWKNYGQVYILDNNAGAEKQIIEITPRAYRVETKKSCQADFSTFKNFIHEFLGQNK